MCEVIVGYEYAFNYLKHLSETKKPYQEDCQEPIPNFNSNTSSMYFQSILTTYD